ncbi:MAG TPA: SBBP repeat-containing protein, partial [Candidatus Kapabacteria bacterium]|nr:SBBP repeat-containing protein [Candidatus Kapabacteria bacterium]
MKRLLLIICCISTLLLGTGAAYKGSIITPIPDIQKPGKKALVDSNFGKTGLYFITNKGQVNKEALFYARTTDYTLWVTKQGLVFDSFKNLKDDVRKSERDVSRLTFLNSRRNPEIVPENPTDYRVNYLKGNNPSGWYTQIPSSERVCYRNLYNHIDLKIYGVEKEIEYDWIIKPGGNPSDILFDYQQIKKSSIDQTGNLVIQTAFGEWLHKKPVGYQVINGKRVPVEIGFTKVKKEKAAHVYGFKVSPYDKSHELIIDPMVIAFSTYLGGNSWEKLNKIVLHNGSIYATGYTDSANFPTMNAIQDTMAGSSDAFITKYSADGSSLVYSTYLGGSSFEGAQAIDVDNNGNVYITGFTDSSDFPTVSPYQNTLAGSSDAFITKISADGSSLLYSTYLGGSNADEASDIFVNSSSEIYVAGKTFSSNFPLQNALESNFNGGSNSGNLDAFITKLSASGSSLIFSTYLGGSGDDNAKSLDIDNYGNIYAGGCTYSSDFPVYNGYQMFIGSQNYSDGFLTKITPDGSALTFSTYLGGDSTDEISDVDTDTTGIYVTGETWSYYFPTTANAYQTTMPGDAAAFISKFNLSGSSLFYSSFLGGSGTTRANGIVANPDGSAYIVGSTNSSNFPQVNPVQYITIPGNIVAFITRFLADGT